jgi:RES domain-containing protein
MLAWRLCRKAFADLSGEGARIHGGRWSGPGHPLLYTASAAALAVLELRVQLDLPLELVPDDYVLLTIDLVELPTEILPSMPDDPRAFGEEWLREQRTPVLQVPSVIVPESPNLLLNPSHPLAVRARIVTSRPFDFDRRLWLP